MALPPYLPKSVLGNIGLFINNFVKGGIPATLVITNAGTPVDGTTAATYAPPGQLLIDTTNALLYINTGTQNSPVWKLIAANGGLGEANAVVTGITASTTHTLAGATKLTAKLNFISVCAGAADSVSLPSLAVGQSATVFNDGAAAAAVYPFSSGIIIDTGGAGASVVLTNAKRATFFMKDTTHLVSAQLGVVSA